MVGRTRRFRAVSAGIAVLVGAAGAVTTAPLASAEPGGIVISELNYHDGSDLDTADFLELANTGPAAIDMSGWTFTEGITATLPAGSIVPAGGYFVVAADAATFSTNHGFAPDAVYTGKLSNGGETVTLVDTAANVIDTVTYADAAPWPGAPDGTGPSLELRGLTADNTLPESWGPSTVAGGTPRAVNSIDGTATQPAITDVAATPRQPQPGEAIVVSALLPPSATATLTYKVMFGAEITIPFLDDAASPGGAGDGRFAATIPGQGAGQLVRYRINATVGALALSAPSADDTVNYLGVVVRNPSVSTNLPVIEWFMEDSVYNDILANHRFDDYMGEAVIAYNGTVWDNARMRIRGQSSRTQAKVNWEVELPEGYLIDFSPYMPYQLKQFAMQRDPDPLADLAWRTVNESGARGLNITAIRTQRNGQFWSVGRFMEKEDGTWRGAQGVKKWAIYKADGGGLRRTSSVAELVSNLWLDKKTREDEDFSDVWQVGQNVDAPASAAQKAWIEANINVPVLINYMALSSLMRHTDSGWKNWFVARDTEGTGRWELWFWDLNWIWATDAEDHDGLFLEPTVNNKLEVAMLRYPDYKEMFYRRLRTLADQYLGAGQYEAKWDAIVNPYVPDWALDTAAWGTRSSSFARTKFVQGLTDRRTVISENTGAGKPVPPSQSATPNVVINEIQYHPAGAGDTEFVELTNPTNESIDLTGWTIDELGLTIQAGTVLLPGAHVVFVSKDTDFRARYGGDHFVGGQYSGHLNDAGQTLTLRQGARVVDQVTYSATAPWPTAADGTGPSLELMAPGLDNSDPANWSAASTTGGSPAQTNPIVLPPDTTPPSAPGTLATDGAGPGGITLTWGAATDNRGVTGYRVVRNGTTIATVSGLSYTDSAVAASSTYTYAVQALDEAGNVGTASNSVSVTTPPDYVPALFTDSFDGANGSAWSSAWVTSGSSGSATIEGNAGRLAFNNVSGAYSATQLAGLANRADSETLLSYRWNATGNRAYFNVYTRGSGGWQNAYRPRSGYGLELSSSSASVSVKRNVNGTVTTLRTVSGAQSVSTQKQWLRLRVVGNTIQFKIWTDGTTEPAAWAATVTDTSVTAPGQLYMSIARSGSNSGNRYVDIDDLSITGEGGVTPPADTTPPSVPTGLASSNVTSTGATLTWTPSTDNVGVSGYQVLRNGVVVGTPSTATFNDSGLAPSTTYSYTVRALDAAGNISAASAALSVTTDSGTPSSSLFSDLFTAANGTPWGSAWTTNTSAGTADVQSNAGRLAVNNTSGAYARAQLTGLADRTDSEVLFSYRWGAGSGSGYFNVFTRGSGGWQNAYRPRSGYGVELSSKSSTVTVKRNVNGTVTNLTSVSGAQSTSTQKQWLRLRVVGNTIQFKTWLDGSAEPTTWRATVTDSSVSASGGLYLAMVRSSSSSAAKEVTIDDLEVTAGN